MAVSMVSCENKHDTLTNYIALSEWSRMKYVSLNIWKLPLWNISNDPLLNSFSSSSVNFSSLNAEISVSFCYIICWRVIVNGASLIKKKLIVWFCLLNVQLFHICSETREIQFVGPVLRDSLGLLVGNCECLWKMRVYWIWTETKPNNRPKGRRIFSCFQIPVVILYNYIFRALFENKILFKLTGRKS